MNGNNGNNGNNGPGNNNGWQRVNNQNYQSNQNNQNNQSNQNYQNNQNGPFSGNQNNGQNGPFNNPMSGQWAPPHENYNGHGHGSRNNPSSIFDFAFYLIGLSVEITFKAFEMVFEVIGEIFGGKKKYAPKNTYQNTYQYDRKKNGYTQTQNQQSENTTSQYNQGNTGGAGNMGPNNNSSKDSYKEAKQSYKEEKRANRDERREARRENRNSDNNAGDNGGKEPEMKETKLSLVRKDGLLMLFLLMTIPLIVLVAMKLIVPAAIVLGGGIVAMTLFNGVMTGVINKKEKGDNSQAEENEEESGADDKLSEVEKVMEAAFDKVFEIRKDMILIPDGVVKDKIESICSISEKIIGEVRSTPEIYPQSKRFFYYNLDSFNEIFNKYVKLLNYREESAETNRTLFETEKAFGNIEAIFKEILTKVLERDLINLKAEINVMKGSQ